MSGLDRVPWAIEPPSPWLPEFVAAEPDPCSFPRMDLWPAVAELVRRVLGAGRLLLRGVTDGR